MNKEVYLICKSYVDGFDVLEVCTEYLNALSELTNIKKYSTYEEPEEKYHIYCLELNKYYNYDNFHKSES